MKYMYAFLNTIMVLLCLSTATYGYHIIGGEVTYDCLGNDRYEITFTMYRDCSTAQGAEFDSAPNSGVKGTVTVWREDLDRPFIKTIVLDPPRVTRIDPTEENPCLTIPPNVCVEKGVYKFQITLPQSAFSYHIVYQRCCRNTTIVNVIDPGSIGATYQTEITPEAQQQCVDSPVFNRFPPIVICAGYPLVVDQSVTDNDPNTTIEYSLCAPFEGGGRLGSTTQSGDREAPNGITPNPDTRPPYTEVTYNQAYNAQNPLNGSTPLSIDSQTGIITGTPAAVGQYVVGVCVKQYKNGRLLTELKRDFQFNVTECVPKVNAKLNIENQIDNGYSLLKCGSNTITIKNESTDEDFIESYDWILNVNGTKEVINTRDLTYTFPDTGVYDVKMLLNKGINACNDSTIVRVEVRNEIVSDHSLIGDECDPQSVEVMNNSYSDNGSITTYTWDFDQGLTSSEAAPDVPFREPGNKDVFLAVEDKYGCVDTSFSEYAYFPRPAVIDISLDKELLCTRTAIGIENNSYPLDSTYQVNWYLSNGDLYTGVEPTFEFEEAGNLDLILEIISPIGCMRTDTFMNFFNVQSKPYALFTYSPENLSQFQKRVEFINNSRNADRYNWKFDDDGVSMNVNPIFTFPDTGFKEVTLYAIEENGCIDTISKILDIKPLATYFLPTAFTPDEDGINDGYRGEGYFPFISEFNMSIFTRYGEKVFETDDPLETWNGYYNNTGERLPQGVYVVQVHFLDPRNNVIRKKEFATLLD